MRKVWVLDTETKGTGANVVPLERAQEKAGPQTRRRPRSSNPVEPKPRARGQSARGQRAGVQRTSAPLPAGHVRKKSTGEIGRVKAVDPKAGTATVLWLRHGTTSTVPLAAISRR